VKHLEIGEVPREGLGGGAPLGSDGGLAGGGLGLPEALDSPRLGGVRGGGGLVAPQELGSEEVAEGAVKHPWLLRQPVPHPPAY
jgi:hypothetical protein